MDADVEQCELAEADERADEQQVTPGERGPSDEEHGWDTHDDEADGEEEQGRHIVEPDPDGHEVAAPDERDEDGQCGVARTHALESAGTDRERPSNSYGTHHVA